MLAAGCVEWREQKSNTSRPDDIPKCIKPLVMPHCFRHNRVTMLCESGADPLIAMKIVGHTDCRTTANIYSHVRDEILKKAPENKNEVFRQRTEDQRARPRSGPLVRCRNRRLRWSGHPLRFHPQQWPRFTRVTFDLKRSRARGLEEYRMDVLKSRLIACGEHVEKKRTDGSRVSFRQLSQASSFI